MPAALGKILFITGIVLVVLGLLLWFGRSLGLGFLGRLPGDLRFEGKNFVVYVPIVTSLLISVVLTLLLHLFSRR